MKKFFYLSLVLSTLFILSSCQKNNSDTKNDVQVNRISSTINNAQVNDVTNPVENVNSQNGDSNNAQPQLDTTNPAIPETPTPQAEEQPKENIATEFSTKILTKSSNRATNIKITCDKLNETVVRAGTEFSFCQTVGVSKESEGYKKADVIVGDDVIHALGGGNCQVSTTLYNAVLNVSDLSVTERHPHGKDVNYVPEGKDAAIAHGSKDFKFKNNSSKDLKIYASSDGKNVFIKLAFIE